MLNDKKLREEYFAKIDKEVEALAQDAALQDKIDKLIYEYFQSAYVDKLDMMYKKSRETQALDRRRALTKFKQYLFKSRCLAQGGIPYEREL